MAEPVTATAAAVSAGASIYGGLQQRRAAKEAAMAADYRAGVMRLRADQASAEGARELSDTLNAIKAVRASRGLSADSPTARAIRAAERERGAARTNNAALSQLLGMDAERNQARGLRSSANFYAVQGFANAASTLASARQDGAFRGMFGSGNNG